MEGKFRLIMQYSFLDRDLGIAFTIDEGNCPLIPAVGLNQDSSIVVANFGGKPFAWDVNEMKVSQSLPPMPVPASRQQLYARGFRSLVQKAKVGVVVSMRTHFGYLGFECGQESNRYSPQHQP